MSTLQPSKLLDLPNETWFQIIEQLTCDEVRTIAELKRDLFTLVCNTSPCFFPNVLPYMENQDRGFVLLECDDLSSAYSIMNSLNIPAHRTFIVITSPGPQTILKDVRLFNHETGFKYPYGIPHFQTENHDIEREISVFMHYIHQKKIINVSFLNMEVLFYDFGHVYVHELRINDISIHPGDTNPWDSTRIAFPALENLEIEHRTTASHLDPHRVFLHGLKLPALKILKIATLDPRLSNWDLPQLEHLHIFIELYDDTPVENAVTMMHSRLPMLKQFGIRVVCQAPILAFKSDVHLPSLEFLRLDRDWHHSPTADEDMLHCRFEESFLSYFQNHDFKHFSVDSKLAPYDIFNYLPSTLETLSITQQSSLGYSIMEAPISRFPKLKVVDVVLSKDSLEPFSNLSSESVTEVYLHIASERSSPIKIFLEQIERAFPNCHTLHISGNPKNLKAYPSKQVTFHNIKKLVINNELTGSLFDVHTFFEGVRFEALKELIYFEDNEKLSPWYEGDIPKDFDFDAPMLETIQLHIISGVSSPILISRESLPSLKQIHFNKQLDELVVWDRNMMDFEITGCHPKRVLVGEEASKLKRSYHTVHDSPESVDNYNLEADLLMDMQDVIQGDFSLDWEVSSF